MGQIVGGAAKPKRCNLQSLSSLGTPAAGEHILVSSDNSMNAAGQGNFDCYIVGDGTTAATALPLRKINGTLETAVFGESQMISEEGTITEGVRITSSGAITTSSATAYNIIVFPINENTEYTLHIPHISNKYTAKYGFSNNATVITGNSVSDYVYVNEITNDYTITFTKSGYSFVLVCYETSYGVATLEYEQSGGGLVDRVDDIEAELSNIGGEISAQSVRITSIEDELSVVENFTEEDVTDTHYYAFNGDSNAVTYTTSSNFECILIPVSAGDVITAKFVSGNNVPYYYGWYLLDTNYIPLQKPSTTPIDYSADPLVLNVTQDGYFVINRNKIASYYSADLDVIIKKAEQKPWDDLQSQIDELAEEIDGTYPTIIPDVVYGIVGTQLNLWNDAIALSVDKGLHSPINYHIVWNCTKGLVTDRCFRMNPKAADIGDTPCTCKIYNAQGKLVVEKTFVIRVVAANALNTLKRTVLFGDSLGANTALQLYNNFQNSAQFSGTMPAMLGTRAGDGYNYEATGGYGWLEYATSGRAAYRIYVSGVTSLGVGSVYSDTDSHYFEVREVNITDGSGNALLIRAASNAGELVMPTGTLTKVSGTGDDTIPYTGAFKESANPLWNNGALDFANYRTSHLGLSSSEKLDAVFWQLGINGGETIDTMKGWINSLYDAFVADNPNGLFVVGLTPTSGNDVNGSGVNNGASVDTEAYHKKILNRNRLYLELLQDATRPNYRVSPQALFIDRYYGYGFSVRAISSRVAETEQYHNNYVHPTTSGYQQLADGLLGAYVALLTE